MEFMVDFLKRHCLIPFKAVNVGFYKVFEFEQLKESKIVDKFKRVENSK